MRISDILSRKGSRVVTVPSDATMMFAARILKAENIGAAVVVDKPGRIAGMISERDIVWELAAHGDKITEMPISDFMTRMPATCSPDQTVKKVAEIMTLRRIRHLPVVEGGVLKGIVSIGDVLKNRLEETELEAGVMRDAYLASM
jgi:CBS domain-containing protein